jgi:hypothetical protein
MQVDRILVGLPKIFKLHDFYRDRDIDLAKPMLERT